jgi:hypothetical protein
VLIISVERIDVDFGILQNRNQELSELHRRHSLSHKLHFAPKMTTTARVDFSRSEPKQRSRTNGIRLTLSKSHHRKECWREEQEAGRRDRRGRLPRSSAVWHKHEFFATDRGRSDDEFCPPRMRCGKGEGGGGESRRCKILTKSQPTTPRRRFTP